MADSKATAVAAVGHVEPSIEANTAVIDTSERLKTFLVRQHSLTRVEAIKEHRKAVAWCLYMFFTCIMFGFDSLAGGVVISIAEFRKDFGKPFGGQYVIDANWQLGFQAATLGGIIFGGLLTGFGVNKFGRQFCILIAYILNTGGIFLQVFATTPAHFFGGKILTGLPLGCFSTVAPTYASEMAPLSIRGAITAGMNFAIVLGQLIGYGVLREANKYTGKASYRVLFATQWGYVAVGLAILPFFPESPYWLVAKGRHEKARHNLAKVHDAGYDIDGHMAEIHDSLARQNADNESQGSIAECFTRKHIIRTLVATSMFFIQNASGNSWVIGYMSYFMQLGGMSVSKSFDTTVGMSGLMVVGNMFGWLLVEKFGRRTTALYGTGVLCVTLFVIGIIASVKNAKGAIWGQVAFMGIWAFVYQATVGSSAWPISAENPSSRLRAPTQALGTMMNGLSSCIWSFSLPYAINPDKGNLGGKVAFIFGATLVLCFVFVFFFIPETKDRTFIEIDELYGRGVPAWKWKQTQIVTVAEEKTEEAIGGKSEVAH
ncbi:general substrate transporter [Cucurbitaria berberidis CBS 394.84]|uniref:General substrate transporter n=1 Tax=Cucurbitaria berberidis CBS 394.84 TaxID=1168544 RepID=A0A9P4GM91_9PLEO|nr:general substrate transporter [Cucurbitaria berberidis CBS 394.84]KAF1848237.1 general substrate transporter [Cucurbitaria berberidis CBS 394.84]